MNMPSASNRLVVRRLVSMLCVTLCALLCATPAPAAPSTFNVSANKHYWLKDGVPFITIGFNRYDVWNPTDTANDGLSVTAYVQRMAQNGANVIRVWAEQGDQNASGDYWLEYPAGVYRPTQAARLDELFDACDAYGVYVEICPWDTYNIKNNWAAHAYNSANGGPCNTAAEVVTSANARALVKSKIQYIYNRWGAHPSFFLWTFNEIDILNTNSAAQQGFAQDVGNFIKSVDPYHPFTVSYTGSGAGNPAVEQLAAIGAADIHFYGAISGTGGVAKENETAVTRDGGYMNFGKPLVLSEWGQTRNANSDDLVNALAWGGVGIGASGAGMVWTDKYTYGGITAGHLSTLKNLRAFTNTINWPAFMDNHHASATEVTDAASAVNTYACLNKTQAVVLLAHNRVGSSTATTVTVNGLNAGTYTVDIWRTYAGGKYGTVTATTNTQGQLVISAPAIPTMQALYVHQ
ncbi:MAG TPA: hypothetical protein VKB12_05985 [Pyrinomonadaceae bacterium]|nr:hypothetical protein [Pyrinomonadaceae bacterium]